MRQKHTFILIAVTVFALALAACGDSPSSEPPPVSESPTVYLRSNSFESNHVTIEAGDTVTWVWDDGNTSHDVSGEGFKSEIQSDGDFSHTFDEVGTYSYVCTLHGGMKGIVTVVAASS